MQRTWNLKTITNHNLNRILFNSHSIFNNLSFHKRMSDWAAIRQKKKVEKEKKECVNLEQRKVKLWK